MKVYLAGPMRGYKLFNFPRFNKTARYLRQHGYRVVNPAELDLANGFHPAAKVSTRSLKHFMVRDILSLVKCQAVFLLPNWRRSRGAKAEVAFAISVNLPVYETTFYGPHLGDLQRVWSI